MSEQRNPAPEKQAQTQALAVQEQTLAALLKRYEPNIRAALPAHLKPERILSIIRTAVAVNPGLRRCSPLSVIAGMVLASRLGLECDGILGEAYLVPRWNKNTRRMEASFQMGYQGKIKLTRNSGEIEAVECRLVHEGDIFDVSYEPAVKFNHRPVFGKNRGAPTCAYAYVRYKSGHEQVEIMDYEEILSVRDRFGPKNDAGELVGPWVTDEHEMARKTVLHRAWKWMPKSVEMREAASAEARIDSGQAAETVVLDLPEEEAASAEAAAATHTKKEDLKRRLAEREEPPAHEITHDDTSGGQATGQAGDAQPQSSGPAASDSAGGGGTETAPTPSPAPAATEAPSRMQKLGPPEVKTLPDPLDERYKASMFLRWKGALWTRNEQKSAWVKVETGQGSLLDGQQPQSS